MNKLYESLDGYLQVKQSKNSKSFVDFFLKVIKKALESIKKLNISKRMLMETMTTLSGITLIINVSICSLLISFNSLDSTMILSAITIV
ncbi:hypothetical protein FYJ26_00955 [Anaerococcus sp. WCA-380-WT-2B]|uniref:Uncharacterized protein n=1 Tax=Anaerococcus porci TaxID=2652269 RepID=A0A6N7VT73_9FIRM|nr:hypothetical protein [Anaerococcus porci]MSS77017.1 hypothetical protein [Anaerococcus porci]